MAFYPVALALWTWELRWGGDSGLPPKLVHKSCRKVMIPRFVCAHCNLPIDPRDVEFEPGPGAKVYALKPGLETRRRDAPTRKSAGVDTTMFHSIDTFGDRWSVMLLATLFFGLHRYDEISEALGIATNILADRLRRLLAGGIIEQRLYQDHPPRHEYHLTEKGRDLYPAVVAMHDWTTSWIPSPAGPGLKLKHRPCGHALRGKMICARCDGAVDAHTVTIKSLA
jgi:DNA-binding HxlR family transcriptional regulator